ncbi:MAG: aminopeptidase [Planctomycetota bacterium]
MRRPYELLGIGLAVVMVAAASGGGPPQPATADADTTKVADTIVNQSAGIRVDELVLISGGARDMRLLEDIAVEIRKLGAHPVITIGSDRLTTKMYEEVDARFDAQPPQFSMRLAEIIDAMISVDYTQRQDLLADVPSERLLAHEKAFETVYKKMLERSVLHVHLGNGLYPTRALATQFDVPQEELSKIFWKGINTDYDRLQTVGARVRSSLINGRQVKITASNGTDLSLQIARRKVFVSDGVISSEDRYTGGPACQVWLPAGEVYVTPVPGTAEGTFVAGTFFFEGQRIEGLELRFSDGKLVSMKAKGDITALKQRYDAAPAGRELFAVLDIGINPDIQEAAGSHMVTWMGAGTISIGIGGNTWAGGENDVPYGLYAHLVDGTLAIDGKKLVDGGKKLVDGGRLIEP